MTNAIFLSKIILLYSEDYFEAGLNEEYEK